MIICNTCNYIYKEPKFWPIKCICGNRIYSDNYEKVEIVKSKPIIFNQDYDCKHRKEEVGKLDCTCNGVKSVFRCELHELCMVRKLKPGIPTIEFKDGSKEKKEIVYCNVCQDRDDSESC